MRVIVHSQFVKIEKQVQKRHLVWFYSLIFYGLLFVVICYDMKLVDSLTIDTVGSCLGATSISVNNGGQNGLFYVLPASVSLCIMHYALFTTH